MGAWYQGATFALFPAVTVSSGCRSLQLAVMSSVTNSRTLSTTTERASQTTSAAFKDVLVNVLSACPSERTGIITAKNMQRGSVGVTV